MMGVYGRGMVCRWMDRVTNGYRSEALGVGDILKQDGKGRYELDDT